MTAETKRQSALLAVLLAVLAGVLWWNFRGNAASPPAAPGRPATAAGATDSTAAPTAVEDVRLEALDAARPEPATAARDPFRFGASRQASSLPQPIDFGPPGEQPPSSGAANPNLAAGTGAIPLKFIGIVTEAVPGRKLAVLTDGRNPPFYGREGDIIEGRYRIVRIGVESIELAHVDGRGQQTIRLSGS